MEYADLRRDCVIVRKTVMTSLEYFATPESLTPTELAFGVLRVRDAPSASHQSAVGSFFIALRAHVREHDLGQVWIAPLDVVLDEAKALIVQPDLLYIASRRSDIVHGRVYGPPDLVVEVLSPKPRVGDFDQRLGWFASYGVKECWAYHQTADRLEIIQLSESGVGDRALLGPDEAITSACLPSFSLTLREILQR
jgi:Uma2 family endonuclease